MKKAIWILFELSDDGDKQQVNNWLNGKHALECGENLYFFHENMDVDYNTLLDHIAADIQKKISITGDMRVYAIVNKGTSPVGRFIIGERKSE